MPSEPYMAVISIEVPIPASLIEDDDFGKYEEVEDMVVGQAELQLQEFIMYFRAEVARG